MQKKRVEYQKFLRTKLDDEGYREVFGLSDNIQLEGEEDFVLQREFRIDFVFRKLKVSLLLAGLFSYFRKYNLFEFKSVNDAFDLVTLRKYLGEMFWWLFIKEGGKLGENEVTLTIMTVRRPDKVLNHLKQPHLQIGLQNESPGHYRWLVMGIEVHLLVINELPLRPEHYAWLSFAEGRKFDQYTQQLSEDVAQDERAQIYFDILGELEKEGKERMADEILGRIISEMPPERFEKLLLNLPEEKLFGTISRFPAEQLQKVLTTFPAEQLQKALTAFPAEQLQKALTTFPAERLQKILGGLPKEQLQKALAENFDGTTSTAQRETQSN